MVAEGVAHLLGGRRCGREWVARCPAHCDRTPSLTIRDGDRGVLLHCFAGCSFAKICAAIGVEPADLFADASGATGPLPLALRATGRPTPEPIRAELVGAGEVRLSRGRFVAYYSAPITIKVRRQFHSDLAWATGTETLRS